MANFLAIQPATTPRKKGGRKPRLLVEPAGATKLTGVRQKVFLDRYSEKDKEGNPLEQYPEQMWARVASGIAAFEKTPAEKKKWAREFYRVMSDFRFVPGGRILAGAGTGFDVTFYNCYVLPSPHDSRGGIMQNIYEMIDIMARGGGVGVNLSSLRPRGSRVRQVNGFSSGPMNWAELYSVATHDVIQQGGTRRGALMLMLWDWHPDIEEFISVKKDLSRIVGANLSVCVSDRLMRAVDNDEEWPLLFPDLDDPDYDQVWNGILEDWINMGKKVKTYKKISARALWEMICEAAWASAEPGLHFMERTNKLSNNWYFNKLVCTNPCGEEPLPAYGVCNLGSLNLANFVSDGGEMDYELLADHAAVATRFLDDVIDADPYAVAGTRKTQLEGERRIGLGTMGLGDALIKMGIRYGVEESIPVIEKIYRIVRDVAYDTSADLAAEKGAFPKFDRKKYLEGGFIKRLPGKIRDKIVRQGIRNSFLLMQAPTGSSSLLSGTTSGIEPVYEFSFVRRDRLGEHKIYHPLYQQWQEAHPNQPPPDYFVSANDLTPEGHVRVQAAVQKYVDASISKTVNAPKSHTVEDVKKLYRLAYELGCKGITYMRDSSRPGVLSRDTEDTEKETENTDAVPPDSLIPRPERVAGSTYRIETPVGSAFVTINENEKGEPLEVFINVGKAGSDVTAMAEALGRTVSAALRFSSSLSPKERARELVEQLSGIGGRRSVGFGANRVRSLPDAVAKALATHLGFRFANGNGPLEAEEPEEISEEPLPQTTEGDGQVIFQASAAGETLEAEADICPVCGQATYVFEEACAKCYSCGHSEC